MTDRITPIKNHPLHIHLGVQDISSEAGNGTLKAIVNPNTLNPSGYYHGGIMYTLCDCCAYSGVLSILESNEEAVTHDIHISVLRPGKLNDKVIYQSKLVKRGRTLCFIDVEARIEGKLIATARVTKSIVVQ